jgi:cytochrome c
MFNRVFAAIAAIAALSFAPISPAAAQEADAGQKVFRIHCAVCHANVAGRKGIGPSLFGVVGRTAGTEPGYSYSAANKDSGLVWDAATLDRYLKAPQQVVPGTKMTYAGLKPDDQRAALIVYLATLK